MSRVLASRSQNPPIEVLLAATDVLASGGVLICPTDSVYGVACAATSENPALTRVFELKRRDFAQTLPLLVPRVDDLERWGRAVSPAALRLAEIFWPGALTIVVRAAETLPKDCVARDGTVALRMPALELVRELSLRVGAPLAATSANLHGEPPARSIAELAPALLEGADLVIDGGLAPLGVASTIVDCSSSRPRILRRGALDEKLLFGALGEEPDLGRRGG